LKFPFGDSNAARLFYAGAGRAVHKRSRSPTGGEGKSKKAKGKSTDKKKRGLHQSSWMKTALFFVFPFCLLPFYFCLP
jgi:hypothetical protein